MDEPRIGRNGGEYLATFRIAGPWPGITVKDVESVDSELVRGNREIFRHIAILISFRMNPYLWYFFVSNVVLTSQVT